jgi:hypothetical protein
VTAIRCSSSYERCASTAAATAWASWRSTGNPGVCELLDTATYTGDRSVRSRAAATATDSPSGQSTTFQSAGWSVRTSEPTATFRSSSDHGRTTGSSSTDKPSAARLSPSDVSASTTAGPPKMPWAPAAAACSSPASVDAELIASVVSASFTMRAASDSARCRAR